MSREIHRYPTAADLAQDVAARTVTTIVEAQADGRQVSWVLTGGRIAAAVLEGVRADADAIDWGRIDLWWGDERYLPDGDPQRNDDEADRCLIAHVPIAPERVHRIAGPDRSVSPEDSAAAYERELRAFALRTGDVGLPRFDLVHLSIGPDGHVASLFPESAALHSSDPVIAVHGSPKPPPVRISLGFTALNNAMQAWLLASGAEKAAAVEMCTMSGAGVLQIPAAGISAVNRTLLLVDTEAAGRLDPAIDGR